jgi:cytochrome c oxidase subunit I
LHFWLTFAGVYCIFMPLHWLGLLTQSTLLPETQRAMVASAGASIRTLVTVATIWTVGAQLLFVVNFFGSLWRRSGAELDNPWGASTLEWSIGSPAPEQNFAGQEKVIYRGAYELASPPAQEFVPQHLSPELLTQKAR